MKVTLLTLALTITSLVQAQKFDTKRIYHHIAILASDSMEGRGTGTQGERSASIYLQSEFRKLKLAPKGNDNTYLQTFPFRSGPHGTGDEKVSGNVIGYLDNQAETTVIVGAHFDHLGKDGQESSLDAKPINKIHNGADDNASGVAGVLELARYFSSNNRKENTNFLFLCFSGEELGLLGSKYFTEHSPIPLSMVNYMINLDMIGRLDEKNANLFINGTGTSPRWETLIRELHFTKLNIKTDSSGIGPSDHTSFYLKNIPAIHFFTGAHQDYHKPSDDAEKINLKGEVVVLEFIVALIETLEGQPKLTFLPTKTKTQTERSSFKVTLGIIPNYAGNVQGLKVDGVSEGKPAHKAGIKTGDIIIQMGQYTIQNIEEYMAALSKFEKGQSTTVKVKRDDKEISLVVTF